MKIELTVQKDGMLRYRYDVNRDIGFELHTLAEVGTGYQADFRALIEERGLVVEYGRSINKAPWVADFAIQHRSLE